VIDFTLSRALAAALVCGLSLPLWLLPITRIPALRGRNPVQFLWCATLVVLAWLGAVLLVPSWRPAGIAETAVCLMAMGSAILVYLEVWGLLSRGYTLALLLALEDAGGPLTAGEIALRYRGGDGLGWILRHRVAGMVAARVVRREGDQIVLYGARGAAVAMMYRLGLAALGLRRSA
jgi:hypothetical protein